MQVLILYDSFFGNTEKIAHAVESGFVQVNTARIGDFKLDQPGPALLIVGSPTRGFRPSENTKAFLQALPANALRGVKVAAFDTRIAPADFNNAFLNVMVKLFGYAAEPIAKSLETKGGKRIAPPEGFFVQDTEGPLKAGELERAANWGKQIAASL